MDERLFSNWAGWLKRNNHNNLHFPGIYVLAISQDVLAGKEFSWIKEIKYVGMTNSIKGLKGRLQQFDNTIRGKTGHGGADRFRFDNEPAELFSNLYVTVAPFKCDVKSHLSKDLIIMGDIAKAEYECFARYASIFGSLPKYNDKKKSPKAKKK